MIINLLLVIYIICLLLIIILILSSRGKGAEIGAAFNSSSTDLFGSRGSNSIINKSIVIIALIILIINISLNLVNNNNKQSKLNTLEIDKYQTQHLE